MKGGILKMVKTIKWFDTERQAINYKNKSKRKFKDWSVQGNALVKIRNLDLN